VALPDDAKALRAMCRELGLPDGGTVQGLQARLHAHNTKALAQKPAPAAPAKDDVRLAPAPVVTAAAQSKPSVKPEPKKAAPKVKPTGFRVDVYGTDAVTTFDFATKAAARAFAKAAQRARGVVSIDLIALGTQAAPLILFKAA
jgi:hypothetical protein